MSIFTFIQLILGLVLLVFGADWLVESASRTAVRIGISSLVVGLTIVAFGTSSPELAVNLESAFTGHADIAVGNVIGSNICNVLLVLGLCALISPMNIAKQLLHFDVPIMIAASIFALIFSQDGNINRLEGILFFSGAITYTLTLLRGSRQQNQDSICADEIEEIEVKDSGKNAYLKDILLMLAGLGMLVLGSDLLINSASTIAEAIGVSQLVIGLTIVALGTSLPELMSSVMASLKKKQDISVGNVVGSNIFNILVVLGLTAIISPQGIPVSPSAISFDLPLMVAVALACFPIFVTGKQIARWEGLLFVVYYGAYTGYLILDTVNYENMGLYRQLMGFFVIPLTVITLVVSLGQYFWKSR
ncbi:MAG: calcium/sodium antiporter [Microcystaceae cyanobacterium]